MPRIRNDAAYARKRDAILDAAESLLLRKGYDGLSITDLMVQAGVSKGALYHYFTAKRDVLAALLDRRLDHWTAQLAPIATRPGPADRRLHQALRALAGAKAADQTFLIDVLRGIYAEENVLVRAATRDGMAERLLPLLTRIVADGCADRTFSAADPAATARVVLSLLQECTDRIGRRLLGIADGSGTAAQLEREVAAYLDALHLTLGAAPGSLVFIRPAELRRWTRAARAARPTESRRAS